MNLTEKQQKAQDLVQSVIFKCWEDESFKEELKSNPVKTIEKFIGQPVNLPEGHEIIVVDQSDDNQNVYLNIPKVPSLDELELTEEQLEAIAGGFTPVTLLYFGAGLSVGYIIGTGATR